MIFDYSFQALVSSSSGIGFVTVCLFSFWSRVGLSFILSSEKWHRSCKKLGAGRNRPEIQTCSLQICKGASGSVIISLLNLVCVCHDSLDVCMDCRVVWKRSGFKGGHGLRQRRLKHELPELLIGWFYTERENGHMVLWNLVFAPRV